MCPCESLKKLIDGNQRFASGTSSHPNLGKELRDSLVLEQKPFAAILACSDSRVPVEIIFDVGLGDLFVVRSAGHVLSKEALGSIEYSVKNLGVKLIVILGHDNCGAINAALDICKTNRTEEMSDSMNTLLSHIYPVIDNLDLNQDCSDLIDKAVKANINYQLEDLVKRDEYLAKKIENNELILVGANYKLDTGVVEIIKEYEFSKAR